jgi:hypothetical protein
VAVCDAARHRPLADFLGDLTTARAERERVDAELEATLAKLGLNGFGT